MQQDNIKDFAIAAFRYRGHLNDTDILSLEEVYINMAVTSTIRHLDIERDYIAIEGVKRVYYQLPLGNLKRAYRKYKACSNRYAHRRTNSMATSRKSEEYI